MCIVPSSAHCIVAEEVTSVMDLLLHVDVVIVVVLIEVDLRHRVYVWAYVYCVCVVRCKVYIHTQYT